MPSMAILKPCPSFPIGLQAQAPAARKACRGLSQCALSAKKAENALKFLWGMDQSVCSCQFLGAAVAVQAAGKP